MSEKFSFCEKRKSFTLLKEKRNGFLYNHEGHEEKHNVLTTEDTESTEVFVMNEELKRMLEQRYGVDTRGKDDEAILSDVQQVRQDADERRPVGIEPSTIDREQRSVETVIATEERARVIDWGRLEVVDEILLMDGVQLDEVRRNKLPLLDSHNRSSVRNILGSTINLEVKGSELRGLRIYSEISQPEFVKTAEGHLDAGSVGYRVTAATYIEADETGEVNGKEFTAGNRTLKVATGWVPMEESVVAIGADANAGTRSANGVTIPGAGGNGKRSGSRAKNSNNNINRGQKNMNQYLRKLLENRLGLRSEASDEEANTFFNGLSEEKRNALDKEAKEAEQRGDELESFGKPADPQQSGGDGARSGNGNGLTVVGGQNGNGGEPSGGGGNEPSGGDDGGQRGGGGNEPQNITVEQERERVRSIKHDVFGMSANIDESYRQLMDKMIEDGASVDQARSQLLQKMQKDTPSVGHARVTQDDDEQRQIGMTNALLLRAAPTTAGTLSDQEKEHANEFRGMSLFDMCRDSLIRSGVSERELRGQRKLDIVGAAFTGLLNGRAISHATGDFSNILANTARKVLLAGYQQSAATWQRWCGTMSVSDFKTVDIAALSGFTILNEIPEGSEYPHHSLSDKKETIQAGTRGNIFSITRQAIINDDLNAFSRVPMMQGYAAGRTINRLAVATLLANDNLSDGNALFSDAHSNLLEGTSYEPSTLEKAKDALNNLKKQMRKQTGIEGETLDLQPQVTLAGPTYEDYLREAVNDTSTIASDRTPNRALRGLEVAIEPELENTNITGNSNKATYLFANPSIAPVVMLAFLDGVQEPYLEQRAGWSVDGTEFKVRIDVGAGVADFRGAQKATGVAS